MKKLYIITITFLFLNMMYAEQKSVAVDNAQDLSLPDPHMSMTIHESMLNAFFKSTGKVSGKGKSGAIKYTWTVKRPRIDLEKGVAKFKAKVDLKSGKFKTTRDCNGTVDVKYDRENNLLKVKVTEARVKLDFKLLGKKIKIGSIDLSRFFKQTFEFPGPESVSEGLEIEKPNGDKVVININYLNQQMTIEKDMIKIFSIFEFKQ